MTGGGVSAVSLSRLVQDLFEKVQFFQDIV